MLNEDRIKLMTHMAFYEQHEGKEDIEIGKYFKGDYVSFQMVKTAICITIAYAIIVGMWVLGEANFLMENIQKMDFMDVIKKFLYGYLIMLVVYLVIAFAVYSYRYFKAKKNLKNYYHQLRKLSASYEQDIPKPVTKDSLGGKTRYDHTTRI